MVSLTTYLLIIDVCGVSPKRLIFSGRILNMDSETLGQAMLSSGVTVHIQPELKKNVSICVDARLCSNDVAST